MKKFKVKYITYDGRVFTKEIFGYDQQGAINRLINCKEVYWLTPIPSEKKVESKQDTNINSIKL